ncbi:MAG: hypothetical protein GY833_16515 [Aestuariibacter sp.]|nr:hypothetical protein [Aestuariibacter sp.]
MPKRLVDSRLTGSDKFNGLPTDFDRLLYILLLTNADPFGREEGTPTRVKAMCFPVRNIDLKRIEESMDRLDEAKLIEWYSVDGKMYYEIVQWDKFQRMDLSKRGKRSKYPDNSQIGKNREEQGSVGENKHQEGEYEREQEREREQESETIYTHYKTTVKPGAKTDAIKSITKLLTERKGFTLYTKDQLLLSIDHYVGAVDFPTDPKYRIQANNFFGQQQRFVDFLEMPEMLDPEMVRKAERVAARITEREELERLYPEVK